MWVNIEKLHAKAQTERCEWKNKSTSPGTLTENWEEIRGITDISPLHAFQHSCSCFSLSPLLSASPFCIADHFNNCFKGVIFLSTVYNKLLLCHIYLFISSSIVSLVSYTPHPTAGAISPKYTLQFFLFLPIIFAPAKAPMIFELGSFFLAEVLASQEILLPPLLFSYFTASYSVSLSLFSTTSITTSKLPLCFLSSNLSQDSPHWISQEDPCKDHKIHRKPCQSDEICIGPTCTGSDSPFKPPVSIMNSAVHMVSCKDNKPSMDSHRENKSWKGSPGASHYPEASKR